MKVYNKFARPKSREEWVEAVNYAGATILLDFAIQKGFLEGPRANLERCCAILKEGKQQLIIPQRDIIIKIFAELCQGVEPESAFCLAVSVWSDAQDLISKIREDI